MYRTDTTSRCPGGFTLIEIVLVVAVIGVLAALLAPRAFTFLSDAQRTQAQHDATQIADALSTFFRDVGIPPYKNSTSNPKSQVKGASDFDCLHGSAGNAFDTTTDSTASDTWTSAGGIQCESGSAKRDTLENHLITNTPLGDGGKAYATTGRTRWRGPYIGAIPPDPWGNQYLVNIGKADPSVSKAVWVLSAGPNGLIETASDASATSSFSPGGDDIFARVK